jgi:hypothetical protein
MPVEQFRGYVASLVAAIAVIGGAIGAAWAWYVAGTSGMSTDLALVLSVFTGLIGTGGTFLFMSDASSRASHASERSFATGSDSGKTLPEQVVAAVTTETAVTDEATTTTTTSAPPATSGAAPGGPPPPGPIDDAEAPTP